MPLNPDIALATKTPAFNNPFEVLGQMQQLRQQQQAINSNQALEEERRQKVSKQARDEAAQQKFYSIIAASKTPDEAETRIQIEAPELLQTFREQRLKLDKTAAEISAEQAKLKDSQAGLAKKGQEYAEPFMRMVEKSNYDPKVFDFALGTIALHFPDFPADQMRQRASAGPEAIKQIIDGFKSPQQQNADVNAQTAAAELPGKQADAQVKQQVATGTVGGLTPDQQRQAAYQKLTASETARHNKSSEAIDKQRADKTATTRYQSQDVLNDKGVPVPALFDNTTGQYLDPETRQPIKSPKKVPSAQEMMDSRKFQKSAPILSSIGELSEKINTGSGLLAKAKGGVERAAAKANYDDDVAEYQALVSGFTPLVARSLGHTGVLTQQDVDSVKELFPKPGDSKTLRDRKIGRLMKIIGELETTEGVSGSAPSTDIEFVRDAKTGKLVRKP